MGTTPRTPRRQTAHRITGPAELVQAVPYLLGFHPHRSLVLVGLRSGVLVVTSRLDLIDAHAATLAHTLGAMVRGGASSIVAAVFDDELPADSNVAARTAFLELLHRECMVAGADLLDVLLATGSRWWSLMCGDPDCCPAHGRELPRTPSEFAAAATYDGIVALPDRAAVEALLDPDPDAERESLGPAIEAAENRVVADVLAGQDSRSERSVKRAVFAAARAAHQPGWQGPSEDEVVRFGVALSGATVRNAVWIAVDHRRIDGRPLWRELARRLPSPYDAGALFLFGWATWRAGDATLAGIAAERAVASDPSYGAAELLLAAVSHALDPRQVPRLRMPRSA